MFHRMQYKNVFTWNIMLAAYARNGHLLEAKRLFDEMPERSVVSWNTTLSGYLQEAEVWHAERFFRRMPEWDLFSANITLAAYARNGHPVHAKSLFDNMPSRDAVSWNTLLQAYAQSEDSSRASLLFHKMPCRNVLASTLMVGAFARAGSIRMSMETFQTMSERSSHSWNVMIRAAFEAGELELGNRVFDSMPLHDLVSWNVLLQHSDTLRVVFEYMPGRDVVSWTTLLSSQSRGGCLNEAKRTFHRMPASNILSWTAMITGYALRGNLGEAKALFDELPARDMFAWNAVVLAYVQLGHLELANFVLSLSPKLNSASWNILLQGCTDAGRTNRAKEVFDSIPRPDVISWNFLLGAYARTSFSKTLVCFALMDLEGDIKPDKVTYLRVLEACSLSSSVNPGDMRALLECIKSSQFGSDVSVSNALINVYVKSGDSTRAWEAFRRISKPDVVSWSCLIAGAAQDGRLDEANVLFRAMQLEGLRPTPITYISMLDACANSTNLAEGRALHSRIETEYPDSIQTSGDNTPLVNSLLNMYNKCGRVDEAGRLFEGVRNKDLITWSSWISSLAWNGLAPASMHAFQLMLLEGTSPSSVTGLSILSACSHAGLVDVGLDYFRLMREAGETQPLVRHYECMVDMLSRAGRLEEAEALLRDMPFEAGSSSRMSLLSASSLEYV